MKIALLGLAAVGLALVVWGSIRTYRGQVTARDTAGALLEIDAPERKDRLGLVVSLLGGVVSFLAALLAAQQG